jgi:hypothetical protein
MKVKRPPKQGFLKLVKETEGFRFHFETEEGKFYSPFFKTEDEAWKWFLGLKEETTRTKEDE